jgi:hypothetical protein
MKEATKIHEVLNYVLDKAVLKQQVTEVTIRVNYSDLCNESNDDEPGTEPLEKPSTVDLVIKISTSFDTRNELIEFEQSSGDEEDEDERYNPNSDIDKEGH